MSAKVAVHVDKDQNVETTFYPSDLIVLLDIDHTMIFRQKFDTKAKADAYIEGMPKDPKSNKTVDFMHFQGCGDSVYHVNLRPGLQEFLYEVATTFETHIFTAGVQPYANAIAKALDPDGSYFGNRIWCRDHCCKRGHDGNLFVKDLSTLPLDRGLDRVVLIDDNVGNLRASPSNTWKVKSFEDDPKDSELQKVLATLKTFQDSTIDVRPILRKKKEEVDPEWFCH